LRCFKCCKFESLLFGRQNCDNRSECLCRRISTLFRCGIFSKTLTTNIFTLNYLETNYAPYRKNFNGLFNYVSGPRLLKASGPGQRPIPPAAVTESFNIKIWGITIN
jgi:hypothetical protein